VQRNRIGKTVLALLFSAFCVTPAHAQIAQKVVDVPTRKGVFQRMIVLSPPHPKAAVILFAGGNGGLQITRDGSIKKEKGNFLVRSRQLFAQSGLFVVVVDAPSDHQSPPFLAGFRQTPEHAADIKAVITWVRGQAQVPVWLVGTSRGTQSAAYVATELNGPEGPDGLVLTSSILIDNKERSVPEMPLGKLHIPVLVVHHEQDGCSHCPFKDVPKLMEKISNSPRKQLLTVTGGESRGDPCEARAYHGFNGLDREVVTKIAQWILAK
jgi:pimeloyl-ACP methyl ester carboxylesterase